MLRAVGGTFRGAGDGDGAKVVGHEAGEGCTSSTPVAEELVSLVVPLANKNNPPAARMVFNCCL